MIHILWPTARPSVFIETYKIWIDNACNSRKIKIYTAVNTQEEAEQLKDYNCIVTGDYIGVTIPATALSKALIDMDLPDDDLVILASDDMFPPLHWDLLLDHCFKNYDGCIIFNDGVQYNPIVTLPIMTINTLKQLNGIIYNPAYAHSCSDNELYDNLKEMGLLQDIRKTSPLILFEHRHYIVGKRKADNVDRRFLSCGRNDGLVYIQRKVMLLKDRLQ